MDRFKKSKFLLLGSLILLSPCGKAQDLPQAAGIITQSHGTVTFLPFKAGGKVSEVKEKGQLMTQGSYLTHDDSFLTTQLFEGSWLRSSPRSKFSLALDRKTKMITVHLYTGSLKFLISQHLNKGALEKIIIKSGDSVVEASEAKFSVVRNPLLDSLSVYVEKGVVSTSRSAGEQASLQLVHAQETMTLNDKGDVLTAPRKMDKKELKFLENAFYLKSSLKKSL